MAAEGTVSSVSHMMSSDAPDNAELELMRARDRLLAGDVVAIPTETVYGLAASIESEAGLKRVFSLKERPFFDPLIVHVASLKEAESLVREWPPLADFLARMFWPGPLTLVLPKAEHVNPLITSGLETVALRLPNHDLTLDLIRRVGTPLAAPSANKFGRTSPSRAEHVRAEFPNEMLMILDGGECAVGIESTVIDFGEDLMNMSPMAPAEIRILRPGGVTEESLKKALEKWSHPVLVRHMNSEASPGHLKHHYMPRIPLVIIDASDDLPDGLPESTLRRIQSALHLNEIRNARELSLSDDAALAARELYSEMRRLAESGADLLYVRRSSARQTGLWQAIWDRLTRAASLNLTTSTLPPMTAPPSTS